MASIARGWRFEEEIIRTLARRSRASGETQTAIVTRALRRELGLAPAASTAGRVSGPASAEKAPPAEARVAKVAMVHLPTWLQGKTGLPRAACRAMIHRGGVRVGGELATEFDLPVRDLERGVEISGRVYYP